MLFIKLIQWFARVMTYICMILTPALLIATGLGMLSNGGYGQSHTHTHSPHAEPCPGHGGPAVYHTMLAANGSSRWERFH